jgi:hypothetical protein
VGPTRQAPSPLWARAHGTHPSAPFLARVTNKQPPLFGPAPAARHDVGGGVAASPIKCREPYPPPRATVPRTAPAAASLRPLRCRPRPPRSTQTRPPSCAALGRRPRWAADAEAGATTEVGTASTGVATEARTASTGGGLEARLGRLDGWPRWRHPCGAGKRRGRLDGDLDAARASSTERLDGDLHAMQAPRRRPRCSKCRCRLHPPHEPHTVEEPRDVHPSALPK